MKKIYKFTKFAETKGLPHNSKLVLAETVFDAIKIIDTYLFEYDSISLTNYDVITTPKSK